MTGLHARDEGQSPRLRGWWPEVARLRDTSSGNAEFRADLQAVVRRLFAWTRVVESWMAGARSVSIGGLVVG